MRGNNLIFPEAAAPISEISSAVYRAMQNHENYHKGVLAAVGALHKLDLHTLQFLRKKFQEPNMRHQHPKGPDFEQGESYAFARIDEFLAGAIEQAGGTEVKPKYSDPLIWPKKKPEPEIPWEELPGWAKWVAMDANKSWWMYEFKPAQIDNFCAWWVKKGRKKSINDLIPFTAPDWRTSLRQRPKTNEQ